MMVFNQKLKIKVPNSKVSKVKSLNEVYIIVFNQKLEIIQPKAIIQ